MRCFQVINPGQFHVEGTLSAAASPRPLLPDRANCDDIPGRQRESRRDTASPRAIPMPHKPGAFCAPAAARWPAHALALFQACLAAFTGIAQFGDVPPDDLKRHLFSFRSFIPWVASTRFFHD